MATEEEDAKTSAEPETSPQSSADMTSLVKERFEIYYDRPLPELDSNGAAAYEVKDKINPQRRLFALICDNNYSPRLSMLPYLKAIDHPNLLKLVEYGTVYYAPEKSHNMALIYARPGGAKVSTVLEHDEKISHSRFKSLILSLGSACEVLRNYNLTHRAIRLDNLFYKDSSREEFVLGDCAASFPGLYQPSVCETINNMLALPQGRGSGVSSDDMYSVGAVMLAVVLGHEISSPLTNAELINQKLKKGSFATLSGNEKISAQFSPVIKALLEDNEDLRWNHLQVYNCLEGKTTSFSVGEVYDRSVKALTVNGEKYYTVKSAVLAMLNYPDEALTLIRGGKLLEWIKNGLENEKLYAKIDRLIVQYKEKEETRFLVEQVCIMLDPGLPIKTGDIFVFPGGISKAVFYYLKNEKNLDVFYSLFNSDLIKLWYQEQPSLHSPANSSEFKTYIARGDYGYGIDRIMYDFDDDLPCTSPLLGNEFVNTPSKLLRALDDNYAQFKDSLPFDKNIIAWLRCKMGKKIDGILTDINAHQDALQISAVIRLYATIQNKNGPVQVVRLAQWLVNSSKPVVQSYHNIKYQKYLEHELVKIAKNGKIIELYNILENDEARQKDRSEYSDTLKKINLLMSERNRILSGSAKLDEEAKELALRFGAVLSVLTMLSSFVLSLLYWAFK